MAARICSAIGTMNEIDDDSENEGDGFVRTRVTIDISKPLSRGQVITLWLVWMEGRKRGSGRE